MEVIQRNRIVLVSMTALAIVAVFIIALRSFKPANDVQSSLPLLNEFITGQKTVMADYKKLIADTKTVIAAPKKMLADTEKMIADWNNPDVPDEITGDFPLHKAVRFGLKERVETLIAGGADINAKDKTGRTPLIYAVIYLHRDIVRLLLEKGADINARDSNGHTPLYHAINTAGQKDMAEYLRKNGAHE